MKEKRTGLYLKILFNYLLAAAIILFVIFVIPKALAFFWPFVVGWIIAMIANPLVHFMERKIKIVRKHGSAIVIICVLAIVISVLYFVVYVLIKQGVGFASNFTEMYSYVSDQVQSSIAEWRQKYSILPERTRDMFDVLIDNAGKIINYFIEDISSNKISLYSAGNVVKSIAEGLLMTVITILVSYFLTAEHNNIVRFFTQKMPDGVKEVYNLVVSNTVSALGGYVKAQFKIMCFVFLILAVGLIILGVDYAVLFALVIAVVDFLPVFGAGAIIWPWCIYEIIVGNYLMAVILFILYLICQAVRQFLQPKMVADSIGLSPLSTLFFMFVGYRVMGILGMIIGIPIGMIIVSFYKSGVFDRLIKGAEIIISDVNEWRKF